MLLTGWILGAAAVVAMGGGAEVSSEVSSRAEARDPLPVGTAAPVGRGSLAVARDDSFARDAGTILIPVRGITVADLRDTFGEARGGGRSHGAMDILAPRGTPVIAAVDGTVRKLFNSRAGGLTVYQFDRAEERVYYYAHLDRYADGLAEGAFVKQGTVIGYVGTTGNAPPGTPHLHFAIEVLTAEKKWWQGTPINPYPLLAGLSR